LMDIRNDVVRICDIVANVGNGYVCVYRKFGLEVRGQQQSGRNDRTHIENMKDPIEV